MSMFLTNPDNPGSVRKKVVGDVNYALALEKELTCLGVKQYYAQTATIDLKEKWLPHVKDKLTPTQTAIAIYQDVLSFYGDRAVVSQQPARMAE